MSQQGVLRTGVPIMSAEEGGHGSVFRLSIIIHYICCLKGMLVGGKQLQDRPQFIHKSQSQLAFPTQERAVTGFPLSAISKCAAYPHEDCSPPQ